MSYSFEESVDQDCSNCMDTSSESASEQSNLNIVSVLSEYYSYVEDVKQELLERDKPVEQVRLSLQYLSCLTDQSGKQPVFGQSSPIAKAKDLNQLLMNLSNVSSWYNHGLIRHLSDTIIAKNGVNKQLKHDAEDEEENEEEGKYVLLNHPYFKILDQHRSDLLFMLPSVSTGPRLHEDFEEIRVTVKKNYRTLTLDNVNHVHECFAEILGLKMFIVLFQGVSRNERNFSEFLFWIPKSVGAPAMTSVYQNEMKMDAVDIIKIQAQCETITSSVSLQRYFFKGCILLFFVGGEREWVWNNNTEQYY